MSRIRFATLVVCLVVLTGTWSFAGGRPDKGQKDWFGQVALGYSLAQGTFGDIVDDDLLLTGSAIYWPEAWKVGIGLEVSWDEKDVSSGAIRAINDALEEIDPDLGSVTGGDVRTWGISVNAVWGPAGPGQGLYLLGGVGFDDIDARVTETGLVYYPPICDPWWWWCYPGGVGPGTIVTAKDSTTAFTWNAGLGFSFELESGSQIFIEARYKSADTDRKSTETIPVLLGFRW